MSNKDLIRTFERQSGLDIYGLGAKRVKWEAALEKYAQLVVKECQQVSLKNSHRDDDMGAIIARQIKQHFEVNE
jgi:hypothetical protein